MTSATKTRATKTRATLHTSCLVVSSHHYTTNILSHTVISTSTPSKSESPPLQIIQHPIDSSGKIPLWSRQQPRKRSGRRSHIKKSLNVVACREQLPRFCTLTALWTFSSIRLPLVPSFIFILELLFPSGIAPSSTIHFSAPPHNTAPSQLNLHVFQDAAETDESIFNCQCNRYPCYSREERYASQVINIKAKSARPILLHHA